VAAKNPFTYRGYYYDYDLELYYLQTRYYDPVVGRFINADSYVSTGQGLIGNNMFAYCNNNPVMRCDPCGTCFHRWDFWNDCEDCGGQTIGSKMLDYFNRINSIQQQQMELNNRITTEQIQIVQDSAQYMWDAYVHSNELQVQTQYQQHMEVKVFFEDTFSSVARGGDFVVMVISTGSTYAAYAAVVAAPGAVAVLELAIGVGTTVWSILRYFDIID